MTRKSFTTRGLLETSLVAAFALTGSLLTGCGSDLSTAPMLTPEADETGEVLIPDRTGKLPTPVGFEVELLSAKAILRWEAPAIGYTAVVKIDGWEIARVDARDAEYSDNEMRSAGEHVYSVCFAKGGSMSREARQIVIIDRFEPGNGRNDDRPEDGRQ